MVMIEAHPTRERAELARQAFIAAQRLVDRVMQLVIGEVLEPSPEDTYSVILSGGMWLVVYDDPSLDSVTETSSEDERIYDCGD